ncbi:LAMI_0E00870g1_1 [Lachancea mirantina]|uniref:LAMI_0E00870g1_1 n=1 Tax=Lachancea mirantina TaxID=1230905 RepID=A0A1G4JIL9_9SACH|nr:LAMI_0E00870g1_1 [Lachancea mirantina]
MTTYVKLVKGATKIKMAPPKAKYVDPILLGSGQLDEFREIIRALQQRAQDTAWTVVYKTFIVVHLLIREGEKDVTIDYLSRHPDFFRLKDVFNSKLSSGDLQALRRYKEYLQCRCEEYDRTGRDFVRESNTSLKTSGKAAKEGLDLVESLEVQISALIKNRYSQYDLSNDLLMCAFRLLVQDLLVLYNSLNEGIITLLESFFELTHANAERTLELYKRFVELTESVVKYLKTGKAMGLKIPVIKHITTKLIRSLEEHLRDDVKKGQTFSSDDADGKTFAQKQLEQVREQKRRLEEQLQSQQMVLSPTVPQQSTGYNPFGESFSFEQPLVSQPTSNPFVSQVQTPQNVQQQQQQQQQQHPTIFPQYTSQQPQQQTASVQQFTPQQPQQQSFVQNPEISNAFPAQQMQQNMLTGAQTGLQFHQQQAQQQPQQQAQLPPQNFALQAAHTAPNPQHAQYTPVQSLDPSFAPNQAQMGGQLQAHQTGFYSSHTEITPSFTGAGFGGYSPDKSAQVQVPAMTGSKNPFSLENIAKDRDDRERVNPFSQSNYMGTQPGAQVSMPTGPQRQAHTFGGLENLPTVAVFPQQTGQPMPHYTGQQTGQTGQTTGQFTGQQTGQPFQQAQTPFNPFAQPMQSPQNLQGQNFQNQNFQQQNPQQPPQQQFPQQNHYPMYNEAPNLIDI